MAYIYGRTFSIIRILPNDFVFVKGLGKNFFGVVRSKAEALLRTKRAKALLQTYERERKLVRMPYIAQMAIGRR
ncbi:MAG: hypothetical protein Fur0025_26950 [Oscillatoriaceae cyanobacterium]